MLSLLLAKILSPHLSSLFSLPLFLTFCTSLIQVIFSDTSEIQVFYPAISKIITLFCCSIIQSASFRTAEHVRKHFVWVDRSVISCQSLKLARWSPFCRLSRKMFRKKSKKRYSRTNRWKKILSSSFKQPEQSVLSFFLIFANTLTF